MIKAVIFDMDGLIVDSEPIHSKSIELTLNQYGKTPIFHNNGLVHRVGYSGEKEYELLLEKYGLVKEKENFRKKRRNVYMELLKKPLRPKSGFLYLVKLLNKKCIKLGLASSREIRHVKVILKNLKVLDLFDAVSGREIGFQAKPAPDIYIKATKQLKVSPQNCLALEDTEPSVISAKSAGMKVIAIPNKYTSTQDFSKADLVINSLSDIKWSTILSL